MTLSGSVTVALEPVRALQGIGDARPDSGDLILPRFHGHQKSHASAVGVFNMGRKRRNFNAEFKAEAV